MTTRQLSPLQILSRKLRAIALLERFKAHSAEDAWKKASRSMNPEPLRRGRRQLPTLPTLGEVPAPAPGFEPDLASYDWVIVTFSGGKDSLASLIAVLELADRQRVNLADRLELWHHNVDGEPGRPVFMDWPITHHYTQLVADVFGIPVYYSWKLGGFEGELLKQDKRSEPNQWQLPAGGLAQGGGTERSEIGTRRKFPQVTADLSKRWCSAALKIDVGTMAIRGQERFDQARVLLISGERAQESPGRARYETFEPDRADLARKPRKRPSKKPLRHVDRWRPVHSWTAHQVWDAIRRWGVVPHPAYRAGFGRVSCAFCIFGSPNQWATLKELLPAGFERIAQLEQEFGLTIHRQRSVGESAARGRAYEAAGWDVEEGRRLATQTVHDAPVTVDPESWILPMGAFAESAGPI